MELIMTFRKTVFYFVGLQFSLLLLSSALHAQSSPMDYKRWNILDINKIATTFNNAGMLCDGNNQNANLARIPSFEFPIGSGKYYGTCVAVVVGAPYPQDPAVVGGVNPENLAYLDGTMDEGPADFWNEEHFAPYIEFTNPTVASISTDQSSWPASWPGALPNYYYKDLNDQVGIENSGLPVVPIQLDSSTGWPGFGSNGKQLSDQESFSVMYGWGGTDQIGSGNAQTRWLRTQLVMRSMAWKGSLYENFIVWIFVVRNIATQPIVDMGMGIHADLGYLPSFIQGISYDADRHYYDPGLQLAYSWDDDGFEESPTGGVLGPDEIAWGGVVVLEMPGSTKKVEAYDASHFWEGQTSNRGSGGDPEMYYKWNLLNLDDPHDSDGDGMDDDFNENGVADDFEGGPGYYVGSGADGLQIISSGKFTLQPGEMDTLIFATVFGVSEKDIKTNAQRAISLYESDWEVVEAPPAPIVEAFPDDRKVTLVWGTESEKDFQFQGYKLYRSADKGQSWGEESFTDFDGGLHYVPLVQYDLVDEITGFYKTLPEYAWYYLGSDSWVPLRSVVEADTVKGISVNGHLGSFKEGDSVNVFIDRDVLNGTPYYYYIAAYDSGNGIIGPLENTSASNPAELNNTVSVVPFAPLAEENLDNVRVVPNPYLVSAIWEQGYKEHVIQFTGLPYKSEIQIFNASAELIKTLHHENESGIAVWDLKNEFDQLVAAGVYFYYIKTNIGEKTGKFIVIL
jgi:hypothetical protein